MSIRDHERNSRTTVEQVGKKLYQEEKVNYLRIALGLQRIGVDNETADRIIETYEAILRLGGKFSISDAVEIELSLDRKYRKKDLEVHAVPNE
jgi:Trm5-related predicted tRNA methylase